MRLYTNKLLEDIFRQAQATPHKIAMQETSGAKLSYAELVQRINTLASGLAAQGLQRGERVVFLVRPSLSGLVILLAAVRAGASLVVADLAMGRENFESRMQLAAPKWVLAETLLLALQKITPARAYLKRRGLEIPEITGIAGAKIINIGPALPGLGYTLSLRDLEKSASPQFEEETLLPDEETIIIFTSGTTGAPKGVIHTTRSLESTIGLIKNTLKPTPADVFFSSSLHIVIPALCAGATAIIPRGKLSVARNLSLYKKYGVTKTFEVPARLEEFITYCSKTNQTLPAKLDTIMVGAAPTPIKFLARLQPIITPATTVYCVYGMTEILPACAISLTEKLQVGDAEGDLVGTPLPGVNFRVAEDNELVIEGPNLYRGYLGGEIINEHYTGDLGKVDAEGRVLLLGRKKDMIIRGNYNIYPALLETTIEKIPGVRRCAMLGIYNEAKSDEEIVLVVERESEGEEEAFRKFLSQSLLSGPYSIDLYARPDHIVFLPVPLSGRSSKVDKLKLKDQVTQVLLG